MTTQQIYKRIHQLTEYALKHGLILKEDVTYMHNTLISALGLDAYEDVADAEEAEAVLIKLM